MSDDSGATSATSPFSMHLRGEESAGQLAVIEFVFPSGGGPPLHVHPSHGEALYVLDGQMMFRIRDEVVTARSGAFFFAAPGVPTPWPTSAGATRAG